MRLESLQYFVTTAECKSMTHASTILHLSQQCISREIISLEKEMNVTLFHRSKKGVTLTDEGLVAYEQAKTLLSQINDFYNQFKQTKTTLSVYIIAYYCGIKNQVAESLKIYNTLYPNITYEEYIVGTSKINSFLQNETADILITQMEKDEFESIKNSINYEYKLLKSEPLKVAIFHNQAEKKFKPIKFDLNDLQHHSISFYLDQINERSLYYDIANRFGWKHIAYSGNNIDRLWEQSYKEMAVLLLTDSVIIPSSYKNKYMLSDVAQNIEIYTLIFFKTSIKSKLNLDIFELSFINEHI